MSLVVILDLWTLTRNKYGSVFPMRCQVFNEMFPDSTVVTNHVFICADPSRLVFQYPRDHQTGIIVRLASSSDWRHALIMLVWTSPVSDKLAYITLNNLLPLIHIFGATVLYTSRIGPRGTNQNTLCRLLVTTIMGENGSLILVQSLILSKQIVMAVQGCHAPSCVRTNRWTSPALSVQHCCYFQFIQTHLF